jgi:hypothetical protein
MIRWKNICGMQKQNRIIMPGKKNNERIMFTPLGIEKENLHKINLFEQTNYFKIKYKQT